MSMSREKLLEKRKKLQNQRERDEAKLKALQLKLKHSAQKIAEAQRKEEIERKLLLGSFLWQKAQSDASFQAWLIGEIGSSTLSLPEKILLVVSAKA